MQEKALAEARKRKRSQEEVIVISASPAQGAGAMVPGDEASSGHESDAGEEPLRRPRKIQVKAPAIVSAAQTAPEEPRSTAVEQGSPSAPAPAESVAPESARSHPASHHDLVGEPSAPREEGFEGARSEHPPPAEGHPTMPVSGVNS